MRFLRLKLENWRNFRKIDIPLERRMFIIGPNASGKSNLLDAFRFLSDVAELGLKKAVSKRNGVSKIRCLAARKQPHVAIEVDVGDEREVTWTYRLQFSQDFHQNPYVTEEWIKHKGQLKFNRPNPEDKKDKELLTQTHIEQVAQNKNFRDLVDHLKDVKYLHIVPHLIREPERTIKTVNDPYGSDFLERVYITPKKTRDSRLKKICSALKSAVPQLDDLKIDRDEKTGTPHLIGRYNHWRSKGAFQHEDQFSDGTLRLIGLLWAMFEKAGILLLEKPELSLHAQVVQHIPAMINSVTRQRGRQVLISTHSPDILKDPGIAPEEVIILTPDKDGTQASLASADKKIVYMYQQDIPFDEILLPLTAPVGVSRFSEVSFK